MRILLASPCKLPSTLPNWVAGTTTGQLFSTVQYEGGIPQFSGNLLLGRDIAEKIPSHSIVCFGALHRESSYTLRAEQLLFRREQDHFKAVYALSEDGSTSKVSPDLWPATDPQLLSPHLTAEKWTEAARLLGERAGNHRIPPPKPAAEAIIKDLAAEEKEPPSFHSFLQQHAMHFPEDDPTLPPPIPQDPSLIADFVKENQNFYPPAIRQTLQQLARLSLTSNRQMIRLHKILQYGYTPKTAKLSFDATPFDRPLLGRTEALHTLGTALREAAKGSRQLVLIIAPPGHGGGTLLRRLCQAVDKTQLGVVECSSAPLNLAGSSVGYDQSNAGSVSTERFKQVLILKNVDDAWHKKEDKDSAFFLLETLLASNRWCDRFLDVELEFQAKLCVVVVHHLPRELARSFEGLFQYSIDLTEDYSVEDKIQILQARASQGNLTRPAAETLVLSYAPLSLTKAVHLLDRVVAASNPAEEISVLTVNRILKAPSLTPEERLISRYLRHQDQLLPSARELAQAHVDLLSADPDTSSAHERREAARLLQMMLDSIPLAKPIPAPQELHASLDRDILGLSHQKDVIVQWIVNPQGKGLLLVGPPGCAKTSLAHAVSIAMGYKDVVHLDMAHMTPSLLSGSGKLHGSVPGEIARKITQDKGEQRPFVLDEVDKASPEVCFAMLDLLQSGIFLDNALGAMDLRQRPLILTANSLEPLPRPLLDRLIILKMPSYTLPEKAELCAFLWNRQLPGEPALEKQICEQIVHWWCPSGGCRDIQKALQKLTSAYRSGWVPSSDKKALTAILGAPTYYPPPVCRPGPGMAYALAACTDGSGVVTPVQASSAPPGTPPQSFGLGSSATMLDSANLAYLLAPQVACQKYRPMLLAMDAGTGRDGPSAGLPEFIALFSSYKNLRLPAVAATGELLLHGQILAVGGIRQKIDAVLRCQPLIRHLILPEDNRVHLTEDLRSALEKANVSLYFARCVEDVARILLEQIALPAQTASH